MNKIKKKKQPTQIVQIQPEYVAQKKIIEKTLHGLNLKEYNAYLAGGAITSIFTGQEINDYDVYFKSNTDWAAFVSDNINNQVICISEKAVTLRINDLIVQCMRFKYYESPEEIFKTFDFTVCMGAYDFSTGLFSFGKSFFVDLVSKRLIINNSTMYPLNTILRIQKYVAKGYIISKLEHVKILLTLNNVKFATNKDVLDNLSGMYGIAMSNKIDKESEYSCGNFLKELDNEDAFTEVCVDSSAVEKLKKDVELECDYFKLDNNKYMCIPSYKITKEQPYGDEVFFTPTKVYKYVKCKENKLFSVHDSRFEYKIGEVVKPTNTHGLHAGFKRDINSLMYKGNVLIELLWEDKSDLIKYSDGTEKGVFKKLKFLKVCDQSTLKTIATPIFTCLN